MIKFFNLNSSNDARSAVRDSLICQWAIETTTGLRSAIFGMEKEVSSLLEKSKAENVRELMAWISKSHDAMIVKTQSIVPDNGKSARKSQVKLPQEYLKSVNAVLNSEVEYHADLMQIYAELLGPEKRRCISEGFEKLMGHSELESMRSLEKTIAILDKNGREVTGLADWPRIKEWAESMKETKFGSDTLMESFKKALVIVGATEAAALHLERLPNLSTAAKCAIGPSITRQQGLFAAYANASAGLYDVALAYLVTVEQFHDSIAPLLRDIKSNNAKRAVPTSSRDRYTSKMSLDIENLTHFVLHAVIENQKKTSDILEKRGLSPILDDLQKYAGGIEDINQVKELVGAAFGCLERYASEDSITEALRKSITILSECYTRWLVLYSVYGSANPIDAKEIMVAGIKELNDFLLQRMEINTREAIALLKGKIPEEGHADISKWFKDRNSVDFYYNHRDRIMDGMLSYSTILGPVDTIDFVVGELSRSLSMYVLSISALSNAVAGWDTHALWGFHELIKADFWNARFYSENRHLVGSQWN
jgi:hypothetical protein